MRQIILLLLLLSVPAAWAGSPPVELHDDHGGEGGATAGAPPPAQGATPCVGGTAGVYPCKNVDLLSFLPLDQMGGASGNARGSDIWGWTDPQTGREYALMALSYGTSFVDVTDPTHPRWLGFIRSESGQTSGNRDVRVYRDHAYIAADNVGRHGMQVFDLTRLRGVSTPQTFNPDNVFFGVDTVHNIDIDVETGYGYLVGSNQCGGGLYIVDLLDPRNPRQAGCYSQVGYIHDTQCVIYRGADKRFAGREICFASNAKFFSIIDVTDKAAPRLLAHLQYDGVAYCHQGALTEDHRHFLMDDELDERGSGHNTRTYLWDIADLTNPKQFARYDHPTRAIDHDQYVHQGHVYQGNYRAGLRILSLDKVAQGKLTEVGYFDIVPEDDEPVFGGAWGAYPYFRSGTILVPGMEQGLYLVRRTGKQTNPGEPCQAGSQNLCLAGKRFKVDVTWRNQFDGSSGFGVAAKGGGDTSGFFSFGDPSNLELMIKILNDGSHYRLYYGQLTNLSFSIRVTDTKTGLVSFFANGPNNCGGIAELGASDGHGHDDAPAWLGGDPTAAGRPGRGIAEEASLVPVFEAKEAGACTKGPDGLCLLSNRFRARVTWRNQFNGATGAGKARPLSGVTGSFAFTEPSNLELLVKVLDVGGGRILVIWGAMSNLEYSLEVTDTKTGKVKTYHNPAGTYCGGLDEF